MFDYILNQLKNVCKGSPPLARVPLLPEGRSEPALSEVKLSRMGGVGVGGWGGV